MGQRRRGAGFAPEALDGLRISGDGIGKKLHGDVAAKVDVLGPLDHSPASTAQLLKNLVMGDSLALHPSPFTFEKSMGTDYTDWHK